MMKLMGKNFKEVWMSSSRENIKLKFLKLLLKGHLFLVVTCIKIVCHPLEKRLFLTQM